MESSLHTYLKRNNGNFKDFMKKNIFLNSNQMDKIQKYTYLTNKDSESK